MKRFFLLVWLCSASLFAAVPVVDDGVTLAFDKVPVMSFINVVYGDILKENFAVHPDLVNSDKTVTVHFQNKFDKAKLRDFVGNLLEGLGIDAEELAGYVYLHPVVKEQEDKPEFDLFFYRPKFVSVSSLIDITSGLFKDSRFSSQRLIAAAPSVPVPGASSGVKPGASSIGTPALAAVPDSGTSAQSLINKVDQDSFIFRGTKKDIAALQGLLLQLDVRVPELLVRGMVYEVTSGDKSASALQLVLSLLQGQIGLNVGSVVPSGNSVSFHNGSIDAIFSALSSDSRFKSVSNPYLRVKSGASARFSVGSDVPVLGIVQLDRNGNPVQSVEYKPSGVIFDLRPVVRDEVIDLTIGQQLSSFVQTTSGVNNSPTLIKREISTSVGALDGDVILLGGLDDSKSSGDSSGLSFLPKFTRAQGSENSNSQIVLVLQVKKI